MVAEMLRLVNPRAALRHGADPVFEMTRRETERTPVIFVHGMEYYGKHEVVQDLLVPFERATGLITEGAGQLEAHVVHWDSRVEPDGDGLLGRSLYRSCVKAALATWSLGERLAAVEERARETARVLLPELLPRLNGPTQPIVVTHSLGALVWSEVLKLAAREGALPKTPGHWWNLQPAIKWNSFLPGQPYECVPEIYARSGATLSVWCSKLDLVLGTLFLAAKRAAAMGQIGAGGHPACAIEDVTRTALEAHGHTILVKEAGPYFDRVRDLLRVRTRAALSA